MLSPGALKPRLPIELPRFDSFIGRPRRSQATTGITHGCHATPLTSLGGLCLELLSGKGLESAFLEEIGLKHETVLCHHGAVFPKTHMETRTVP